MPINKTTKEQQQKVKAALEALQKESVKNGNSEMTMGEINEEIRQVRESKRKRKENSWLSVDDYFDDLILEDIKKDSVDENDVLEELNRRKIAMSRGAKDLVNEAVEQAKKDVGSSDQITKELFEDEDHD